MSLGLAAAGGGGAGQGRAGRPEARACQRAGGPAGRGQAPPRSTAQLGTHFAAASGAQHPPDIQLLDAQGEAARHLLSDATAHAVEAGVGHPAAAEQQEWGRGVSSRCAAAGGCWYPMWVARRAPRASEGLGRKIHAASAVCLYSVCLYSVRQATSSHTLEEQQVPTRPWLQRCAQAHLWSTCWYCGGRLPPRGAALPTAPRPCRTLIRHSSFPPQLPFPPAELAKGLDHLHRALVCSKELEHKWRSTTLKRRPWLARQPPCNSPTQVQHMLPILEGEAVTRGGGRVAAVGVSGARVCKALVSWNDHDRRAGGG